MKKIQYVYALAIIAVLAGLSYWIVQADNTQSKARGALEVKEEFYDFGTVGLDKVSHPYQIKNAGDGPLTIRKISTSCGCTTAQLKKNDGTQAVFGMDHGGTVPYIDVVLEPGEEAQVIAVYDPLAHGRAQAAGLFSRSIYIVTDNPRGEHELKFKVQVDPDIVLGGPNNSSGEAL